MPGSLGLLLSRPDPVGEGHVRANLPIVIMMFLFPKRNRSFHKDYSQRLRSPANIHHAKAT